MEAHMVALKKNRTPINWALIKNPQFLRNQVIFSKYYPIVQKLGVDEIDNFMDIVDYRSEKHVQYFIGKINDGGLVRDTYHICFFGTNEEEDWKYNLKFRKARLDKTEIKVHEGFHESTELTLKKIHDVMIDIIDSVESEDDCPEFIFTGHSFGAAVAILTAYMLRKEMKESGVTPSVLSHLRGVVIGTPRVGNKEFVKAFSDMYGESFYSYGIGNDVVTKMPPNFIGYRHIKNHITLKYRNKLYKRPFSIKDHLPEIAAYKMLYYLTEQADNILY